MSTWLCLYISFLVPSLRFLPGKTPLCADGGHVDGNKERDIGGIAWMHVQNNRITKRECSTWHSFSYKNTGVHWGHANEYGREKAKLWFSVSRPEMTRKASIKNEGTDTSNSLVVEDQLVCVVVDLNVGNVVNGIFPFNFFSTSLFKAKSVVNIQQLVNSLKRH